MRAKHCLFFFFASFIIIFLAGCGGNGNSLSFPPPAGGFTNANLTGPFAFSYTGTDSRGFLAVAGSFQADGAGHITSGAEDINSGFGIHTNAAISGSYTVRADGRGSATLNSPAGNTTIDFVLVAAGHALVTRFDGNATGSGTVDQQTTSAFSNAALAGTFAFNVSGIDGASLPIGVAGNFTSDASGNITSGLDDSNDSGAVVLSDPLTGSIPVTAGGRGSATLNTSHGSLVFAFYVVDANHLKIVEVDTTLAMGGEAFRQNGPFSPASLSGPFAFSIAGTDLFARGPFAAAGALTSDGGGNITSGTEDLNDSGTVRTGLAISSSTYTMAATGRGTLSLVTSSGTFNFAIYPTTSGVLTLETDSSFVTTGVALTQQTAAFTSSSFSGIYGINFTGSTGSNELDSIAQFTADGSSKVSGIIDLNNTGTITFGQPLSGTFSVAPNGRTTLMLQTPLGTQNMVVYLANGTRALFIELDNNLVAAGDIRHQ